MILDQSYTFSELNFTSNSSLTASFTSLRTHIGLDFTTYEIVNVDDSDSRLGKG